MHREGLAFQMARQTGSVLLYSRQARVKISHFSGPDRNSGHSIRLNCGRLVEMDVLRGPAFLGIPGDPSSSPTHYVQYHADIGGRHQLKPIPVMFY